MQKFSRTNQAQYAMRNNQAQLINAQILRSNIYLLSVSHNKSFSALNPVLVTEDINTCGTFFGSSFAIASFNSSSSISDLLIAMIKSF